MSEIWTVTIAALIGGLVSYAGALVKNALDVRRAIDDSLRAKRELLYQSVWKQTGLLPRRPRTDTVSYAQLSELAVGIRDWYYDGAGLYLSGGSRRAYSAVLDILEEVRKRGQPEKPLTDDDYEEARRACSTLRTWLTRDLVSRRGSPRLLGRQRYSS
jgi:hypothetical protein